MKLMPVFKLTLIVLICFICSFVIMHAITAMLGFKPVSAQETRQLQAEHHVTVLMYESVE
ncbi:hypothetical protein [Bacillus testis]|uniref:hypothetical protein n=1 Tax=Bacillus testis TaxID=1622072 RepID=UPI00067E7CC3|nr:hypothetical protein [Bacillus testis]